MPSPTSLTKDFLVGPRFDIGDFTYGVPEINGSLGKFCSIAAAGACSAAASAAAGQNRVEDDGEEMDG